MAVVLSSAEEEYLEALYAPRSQDKLKIAKLAETLKVKPPSVVQMVHRLVKLGLVKHDRSGVKLTSRGKNTR